jgi:hypothetical protein
LLRCRRGTTCVPGWVSVCNRSHKGQLRGRVAACAPRFLWPSQRYFSQSNPLPLTDSLFPSLLTISFRKTWENCRVRALCRGSALAPKVLQQG